MTEQERDLLRQEAEYRLNDEVFGKISETVIELLDEVEMLKEEVREANRNTDWMNDRRQECELENERLWKALEEIKVESSKMKHVNTFAIRQIARQALEGK
jgi:regulator of replication initiation timing